MKNLVKILLITLTLTASYTALAQVNFWNERVTIRQFQVQTTGAASIFVYVTPSITHDGCDNASSVGGLILRRDSAGFEEAYARLLIAEQNGEEFEVFSNHGECVSNFWIANPTFRFN